MKTLIDPDFWDDPDFDEVEDLITLAVYAYLMSNSKQNIIGVYKFSARRAVTSLRLDKSEILHHIETLQNLEHPKVRYCHDSKWLWVIGSFKRHLKLVRNENTAKHVVGMLEELSSIDFPYLKEFSKKYEREIQLVKNKFLTRHSKDKDKGKDKGKEKDSKTLINYAIDNLNRKLQTEPFKKSISAWIRYLSTKRENRRQRSRLIELSNGARNGDPPLR